METPNGLFLLSGLSLGVVAEFWIAMGNIQIKYSHKIAVSTDIQSPYLHWRWWFGFALLVISIVFDETSYMFASLKILAPTSALCIIINAILARIYFGETLTCSGYLGSINIMIGCIICVIFGTHSQDKLKIDDLFINAWSYKFILFTTIHGSLCIIFGIISATTLADIQLFRNKHQNEDELQHHPEDGFHLYGPEDRSGVIQTINREECKHILRCFLLAFATAGLVSWVQFLGKIFADLCFESIWNQNNQFASPTPWIIVLILAFLCPFELFLLSEIMRIFDAVLIVPVYNSLQILSTIALSSVYFDSFVNFKVGHSLLFAFGLVLIIGGIGAVSHGQKHQSMAHHEDDKRIYNHRAKQNKEELMSESDHDILQMTPLEHSE